MKIAIHTPTEDQYNEFNKRLEEFGFTPLPKNCYSYHKLNTCLDLDILDKVVYYSSNEYYTQNGYKVIPFAELKKANYKIEIQL